MQFAPHAQNSKAQLLSCVYTKSSDAQHPQILTSRNYNAPTLFMELNLNHGAFELPPKNQPAIHHSTITTAAIIPASLSMAVQLPDWAERPSRVALPRRFVEKEENVSI